MAKERNFAVMSVSDNGNATYYGVNITKYNYFKVSAIFSRQKEAFQGKQLFKTVVFNRGYAYPRG
jgi:hypothetical protein